MREREETNGTGDERTEAAEARGVTRRRFLELSAMAAVVAQGGRMAEAAPAAAGESGGIPYRVLGRTGERVSLVGIGGSHMGQAASEAEGIRIVRTALDRGINFLDNSWDYNDGRSEAWMGKALQGGYRQKAFLMTKIDGRTKEAAQAQLDESLKRLRTDHLDLLQFHEVIRMNDPDRIFAPGGALEAAVAARKVGKVRYIGFTGHKSPDIHLHMLETARQHGFDFDTVQMPLNVMDAHYQSFEKRVLPVALERKIGVLGMKPMGSQEILKSKAVTPVECLHYTMSLPVAVCITGCDSLPILEQAIQAARTFRPLTPAQAAAILEKTAPVAMAGKYELYKTSQHFDSTAQHPNWLG